MILFFLTKEVKQEDDNLINTEFGLTNSKWLGSLEWKRLSMRRTEYLISIDHQIILSTCTVYRERKQYIFLEK